MAARYPERPRPSLNSATNNAPRIREACEKLQRRLERDAAAMARAAVHGIPTIIEVFSRRRLNQRLRVAHERGTHDQQGRIGTNLFYWIYGREGLIYPSPPSAFAIIRFYLN